MPNIKNILQTVGLGAVFVILITVAAYFYDSDSGKQADLQEKIGNAGHLLTEELVGSSTANQVVSKAQDFGQAVVATGSASGTVFAGKKSSLSFELRTVGSEKELVLTTKDGQEFSLKVPFMKP